MVTAQNWLFDYLKIADQETIYLKGLTYSFFEKQEPPNIGRRGAKSSSIASPSLKIMLCEVLPPFLYDLKFEHSGHRYAWKFEFLDDWIWSTHHHHGDDEMTFVTKTHPHG